MTDLQQLATEFGDYLKLIINHRGIYPSPAWIITEDGQRHILALAMEANQAFSAALKKAKETPTWRILLAGIDVFCLPGQGTSLDSAFVVVAVQPGQEPSVGVIEYSWRGGSPVVRPVNWQNTFWTAEMEQSGALPLARRLAGLVERGPERH